VIVSENYIEAMTNNPCYIKMTIGTELSLYSVYDLIKPLIETEIGYSYLKRSI